MSNLSNLLSEIGFVQFDTMNEYTTPRPTMIVDEGFDHPNQAILYPVTRKFQLFTSDLFIFYGTHWTYLFDFDTLEIQKKDHDINSVLKAIENGIHLKAKPPTINRNHFEQGNIWALQRKGPAQSFYDKHILPTYQHDLAVYRELKQQAR